MKSPLKTVLLLLGSVVALGALLSQPNPARHSKAVRDAEVITDQADYAPGSTAAIIGSGFRPREQVRLQVLHTDGTPSTGADHEPWFVRSGPHGDFVTAWHVCEDDCVGAVLELTAVGQRSGFTAQAQFTDAPSAGELLQGWFNLARQWGGTIQGSNSKYAEGNTIPLRFTASLSSGSTNTVLLKYDFSNGGNQRFFDSLGSFDASVPNVDPTVGINGLDSLAQQWPIPPDASLRAGAQIPGFVTTYNVFRLTFGSSYTLTNGVKAIPVTIIVTSGGATV